MDEYSIWPKMSCRVRFAVTTYFNLVCEVHREIATAAKMQCLPSMKPIDTSEPGDFLRKVGILSGEDGASAPDPTESGASGESKGEPNPLLKQAKVAAADSIDDINTGVVPVSSRDSEQEKQSPLDSILSSPLLFWSTRLRLSCLVAPLGTRVVTRVIYGYLTQIYLSGR